jgi:murein DD-endopeptidase MepM/ murein hydrolase activator NlpD
LRFELNKSDSVQKRARTTPYVSRLVEDSILEEIFTTDTNFIKKWHNDILFVYWDTKYDIIPDTLKLQLLKNNEEFYFNWRGHLFSGYGPRGNIIHRGLDIDIELGDTIVSSFDGVVRYARFHEGGYGNCVIVRHRNGLETLYAHMSKIIVKENQYVKAGNTLGLCGSTGRSDGPHLHFETRYRDFSFDPYLIIDKNTQELIDTVTNIEKKKIDEFKYNSGRKNYKSGHNKKGSKKYYVKNGRKYALKRKGNKNKRLNKGSMKKKGVNSKVITNKKNIKKNKK